MDFVKYHVFPKGYMIRTSSESNREQVRLSSAALKKGISFRAVGNDFIRQYKQNPNILAVKLISSPPRTRTMPLWSRKPKRSGTSP